MNAVRASISQPIRTGLDWHATWEAADNGLIKCWETGRDLAQNDSNKELKEAALRGELPPSAWKGGVSKKLKKTEKFGSLQYLAQWQGLRGEDLNIDQHAEVTLTCTRTGMHVTFTADLTKLSAATQDENAQGDANHGGSLPGI